MRPLQHLFIEITNHCLMACKHCSSEAYKNSKIKIDLDTYKKLIDEAIPLGLESVSLSGGEPLLHPNWREMVSYAKAYNLKVCVYSCGVYSFDNYLSSMTTKMVKDLTVMGVNQIIFSVQGATPEVHEYITGISGSFELVIDSIKRSISNGLDTEIHFVPTAYNIGDIPNVISLANDLGVKRVSLLRFVQQGRGSQFKNQLAISAKDGLMITNVVEFLRSRYPEIEIRLGAPFNCVKSNDTTACTAANNKLLISANGEVFPCEAFKFLKGHMLKIYDNDLSFIWNNDLLLNRLRSTTIKDIDKCNQCSIASKCRGGCPGERMLFNGDISHGPEVWCQVE